MSQPDKPSLAKLAYELKLLSQREVLETLKRQTRDQSSFVDAASALALWSPEKSQALSSELSKRKLPLGEILVKKRYLELAALTRALDDFFEDASKHEPSSQTTTTRGKTISNRE